MQGITITITITDAMSNKIEEERDCKSSLCGMWNVVSYSSLFADVTCPFMNPLSCEPLLFSGGLLLAQVPFACPAEMG